MHREYFLAFEWLIGVAGVVASTDAANPRSYHIPRMRSSTSSWSGEKEKYPPEKSLIAAWPHSSAMLEEPGSSARNNQPVSALADRLSLFRNESFLISKHAQGNERGVADCPFLC